MEQLPIAKIDAKTKITNISFVHRVLVGGLFVDMVTVGETGKDMKNQITLISNGALIYTRGMNRFIPWANIREVALENVE